MYKSLLRPLLFSLAPEKAHHTTMGLLRNTLRIPGMKSIFKGMYTVKSPKLERTVFGIKFPNPVGLAAGFDKNADYYEELSTLGFGFIEIGTVTPVGQPGNPQPRMFRLPADEGLINRMGFNNGGMEQAIQNLKGRNPNFIIGGNIGKNKVTPNEEAINDYIKAFNGLFDYVDYFVVNVSSPNTPGLRELQDKKPLTEILMALKAENKKQAAEKPILLKIAPDLTDAQLDDIIAIVSDSKIDGVIATNTTISREGLRTDPKTTGEAGGLSGAPVKNRSTEVIKYLHTKSNGSFPIIGVGGIQTAQDAQEKLDAGASLVQVYTGFIYEGPAMVKKINEGLLKNR
jgi:dihydroorotate dehydrogenase